METTFATEYRIFTEIINSANKKNKGCITVVRSPSTAGMYMASQFLREALLLLYAGKKLPSNSTQSRKSGKSDKSDVVPQTSGSYFDEVSWFSTAELKKSLPTESQWVRAISSQRHVVFHGSITRSILSLCTLLASHSFVWVVGPGPMFYFPHLTFLDVSDEASSEATMPLMDRSYQTFRYPCMDQYAAQLTPNQAITLVSFFVAAREKDITEDYVRSRKRHHRRASNTLTDDYNTRLVTKGTLEKAFRFVHRDVFGTLHAEEDAIRKNGGSRRIAGEATLPDCDGLGYTPLTSLPQYPELSDVAQICHGEYVRLVSHHRGCVGVGPDSDVLPHAEAHAKYRTSLPPELVEQCCQGLGIRFSSYA